ncbi:hypothetical protein ACGF1Z_22830 [Streptomyces sp. NPDC048018]|uniref:hypothetical protein n=1 Tax=Streptomyces sp. NPDC048018 TaxID=3365499 RepID=UPI0037190067
MAVMRRRKRPGLAVVALCLGGALTACGAGGDGEGYAAVGTGSSPKSAVPPSGSVTLVPLDPAPTTDPGLTSSTSSPSPRPPGAPGTDPGTRTGTAPGGTATAPPAVPGGPPPRTPDRPTAPGTTPTRPSTPAPSTPGTSPTTPPPSPEPPAPAALTLSAPVLTDTDRRWCENVTVTFRNTGGTAVRSGTVSFATHVIGSLGVDWATVRSSQSLPSPIAAGATQTHTYSVCLESWRVPLGMHVDTREVTAAWR